MNTDNTSEMNPFFTTLKIRSCEGDAAAQALLEAYGRQQVQAAMAQLVPRIESAIAQATLEGAELELKRVNTAFDSYATQLTAQAAALQSEGLPGHEGLQAQLSALRLLREAVQV